MSSSNENIKITKFDGERSNWKLWSELFQAKMMMKGLLEVIEIKPEELPSKSEDMSKGSVKKLVDKNKMAYAELISSMDMKTRKGCMAMNMIVSTKTEEYPYGNVSKAWRNLERKYSPKTSAEMSRVKSNYVNAKLKFGADPDRKSVV